MLQLVRNSDEKVGNASQDASQLHVQINFLRILYSHGENAQK